MFDPKSIMSFNQWLFKDIVNNDVDVVNAFSKVVNHYEDIVNHNEE